jgi:hypothetical protein
MRIIKPKVINRPIHQIIACVTSPTAYRYISDVEAQLVQSRDPWRVPNVDRFGNPKTVYMTWDLYHSARDAESALLIGRRNPNGPTATPTHRLELDLTGVRYQDNGIVLGGTGTEFTTEDEPLVTRINPLQP